MRLIHHKQERQEDIIWRGEVHAYDDKEQYETYKHIWEKAGFSLLFAMEIDGVINAIYTRATGIKGAE